MEPFFVVQLTLVAWILSVNETATNLDLQITDGTGQMQAKLYADADDEESVRPLRTT